MCKNGGEERIEQLEREECMCVCSVCVCVSISDTYMICSNNREVVKDT